MNIPEQLISTAADHKLADTDNIFMGEKSQTEINEELSGKQDPLADTAKLVRSGETTGYAPEDGSHSTTITKEEIAAMGFYEKPANGILRTDMDADVQASLNLADTALQSHQDISGKFDKANITNEAGSSTEKVMSQQAVTDGLMAIIDSTTESLVNETQQRVAADAQIAIRVQIIDKNDAEYTAGAFRGWLAYGQPSCEGIVKFAAWQCPLYPTATEALQCWYKWMAEYQDGTPSANGVLILYPFDFTSSKFCIQRRQATAWKDVVTFTGTT